MNLIETGDPKAYVSMLTGEIQTVYVLNGMAYGEGWDNL